MLDSLQDVPDVIFPVAQCGRHDLVLGERRHTVAPNRLEVIQVLLVAIVNVVNLILIDETLDALVDLILVRPEVQGRIVLHTHAFRLFPFFSALRLSAHNFSTFLQSLHLKALQGTHQVSLLSIVGGCGSASAGHLVAQRVLRTRLFAL